MAGIYIHIPFCRQACTYCNFHFSTNLSLKADVITAITKEILLFNGPQTTEINTIYFGGGTPSLLSVEELSSLMEAIYKKFTVSKDAEVTFESNPDNINLQALRDWKSAGINRLSVGIQSFSSEELIWMNRAHTAEQSLLCLDDINKAGFTNYSIDLIYGSPLLTSEILKRDTDIIISRDIPHISCYALTVEPKTALEFQIKNKKSLPVNPDEQSHQYLLLMEWLHAAGYIHYEISNFSKPGMESRHNSSYWKGTPYYGFGPSAHSYDGINKRQWNVANNALYVQSININQIPFTEETLTPEQQLNEYIMIALRTSSGIDLQKVKNLFGEVETKRINERSAKWISGGRMFQEKENLVLTNEGKLLADGIASDLFV